MALVAQPYKLSVVLGCKNDKTMTVSYNLTASDEATALTQRGVVLSALGNVSAGVVKATSLILKHEEDAYVRPTDADAEYGDKATITTNIVDLPTKTANIGIPMPKSGIFEATEGVLMDQIDTGDVAVIAYHGLFKATGVATISDGEQAETLLYGVRG